MEKLRLIDILDEDKKKAIFLIIDGLIDKKKLKIIFKTYFLRFILN